jgi:peroxiredoxin
MTEEWPAPDVSLLDAAARVVALRQLRGRPVLLVFPRWLG